MIDQFQAEWRDENERSRYPFADDANPRSAGRTISNDLFLDAIFYVETVSDRLYLTQIDVESDLITIYIGTKSSRFLLKTTFLPTAPPDSLVFQDTATRPSGMVISDATRLLRFRGWPTGSYNFGDTAEFVSACIVPAPERCVRAFSALNGFQNSGDVWFFGENGVQLRGFSAFGGATVLVDIVGDPMFKRKLCNGAETFPTRVFLQTINGVPADAYGNWIFSLNDELAAKPALRVDVRDGALVFEIAARGNLEDA
jgi:hypothetical protein